MFETKISRVAVTAVSAVALCGFWAAPALAAPSAEPTAKPTASSTVKQTTAVKVAFTAPSSSTSAAVIRITGAKPGEQIEAYVGKVSDKHQPYATASGYADAKGNLTLTLKPSVGWASNTQYFWAAGYKTYDSGVFTTPNWSKTTKPTSSATKKSTSEPTKKSTSDATKNSTEKDPNGGLAKTGC